MIRKRGQKANRRRSSNRVSFDVWTAAMAYARDARGRLLDEHTDLIQGLIRARSVSSLADVRTLIGFEYLDPDATSILLQVEAFFKKDASFADDALCTEAAKATFHLAEDHCRSTNERLCEFFAKEPTMCSDSPDWQMLVWVERMRRDLAKLFGSTHDFHNRLPSLVRVSSGATSTRSRRESVPYMKFRRRIPVTPLAKPYLKAYCQSKGYSWFDRRCEVVDSNRIAVVPKSWKTHRTIAAEPEGNLFFQLAVDAFIKERLLSRGINLMSQAENQRLAKVGSITNDLATVDMSMASDTLALELVPFLLPEGWTKVLLSLRSPKYSGPFGDGVYQKFSSMGNGFTFTLETAVFWAAARAVGSRTVSVYGDDVIIDSSRYEAFASLLGFLGFLINEGKSYHAGPFRESCGADYFNGVNVRAFYVRKHGDLGRSELCHTINGLARVSLVGGKLLELCAKLTKENRLPLVPHNDSTLSGVHISVGHAYQAGLMQKAPKKSLIGGWHVPAYRSYQAKTETREIVDSRTMILWHIEKARVPEAVCVTSVVPANVVKTTYGWTAWVIPQAQTPDSLFWLSELLVA